jgi:hypothetical protein
MDLATLGSLRRLAMPTFRNLALKARTATEVSLFYASVSSALTATGTSSQANALPLISRLNIFTTVPANSGAMLPSTATTPSTGAAYNIGSNSPGVGAEVFVVNATATPLQVYGAGTDTINGIAFGTGFTQPANSIGIYVVGVTGTWYGAVEASSSTGSGSNVFANGPTLTSVTTDSIVATGNSTGGFIDAVNTVNSTATAFTNNGLTIFGSSVAKTFTLGAPTAGTQKFLHFNGSSAGNVSTAIMTVNSGSSLITFGQGASSFTNILLGSTVFSDFAVGLHGESSTKWVVTSLVTQGSTSGAFGSTALGITLST